MTRHAIFLGEKMCSLGKIYLKRSTLAGREVGHASSIGLALTRRDYILTPVYLP
jgi:hypothetical protein